jgi:hypothetical protein
MDEDRQPSLHAKSRHKAVSAAGHGGVMRDGSWSQRLRIMSSQAQYTMLAARLGSRNPQVVQGRAEMVANVVSARMLAGIPHGLLRGR